MPTLSVESFSVLRLTLVPGVGPVLLRRAIALLGSAAAVLEAPEAALRRIEGIGAERARKIAGALVQTQGLAEDEVARAENMGVGLVSFLDAGYPTLLRELPDAPPILFVRGQLDARLDRYPLGVVGSRACTHYGIEQTERFSAALAQSGITIVSGGARGIDTAAHRAALRVKGRTIAVLGCGLANVYPPDNRGLFEQIAEAGGAVISELPLNTPPAAENFPARNRIISGLSLGVLVVEAGRKSGALITARLAAEDHGREVFAIPTRLDSPAGEGSLDLLKAGGAALVTHPDDILQALESPARHHFDGTHEARYPAAAVGGNGGEDGAESSELFGGRGLCEDADEAACINDDGVVRELGSAIEAKTGVRSGAKTGVAKGGDELRAMSVRDASLTPAQRSVLDALADPRSMDDLAQLTGLSLGVLRAEITMLEIKRRVTRRGSLIAIAAANA